MVEEYLHTKKLKERLRFTIVRFPFYYNNLVSLFTPRKKDDGTLLYDIPMEGVAMDGIDVTQGGECVYGKRNSFAHCFPFFSYYSRSCCLIFDPSYLLQAFWRARTVTVSKPLV